MITEWCVNMKRFLDKVHCVAMDIRMVTELLCLLLWIAIIIMDKIIYPFFIIIKNMSSHWFTHHLIAHVRIKLVVLTRVACLVWFLNYFVWSQVSIFDLFRKLITNNNSSRKHDGAFMGLWSESKCHRKTIIYNNE